MTHCLLAEACYETLLSGSRGAYDARAVSSRFSGQNPCTAIIKLQRLLRMEVKETRAHRPSSPDASCETALSSAASPREAGALTLEAEKNIKQQLGKKGSATAPGDTGEADVAGVAGAGRDRLGVRPTRCQTFAVKWA